MILKTILTFIIIGTNIALAKTYSNVPALNYNLEDYQEDNDSVLYFIQNLYYAGEDFKIKALVDCNSNLDKVCESLTRSENSKYIGKTLECVSSETQIRNAENIRLLNTTSEVLSEVLDAVESVFICPTGDYECLNMYREKYNIRIPYIYISESGEKSLKIASHYENSVNAIFGFRSSPRSVIKSISCIE